MYFYGRHGSPGAPFGVGCPAIRAARVSCIPVRQLIHWREKEEVLDDRQFDDMTRVLGQQSGRRGMLKAAAGGMLGLVGLSALTDGALARRCSTNDDCPANKLCDNRKCVECKNDRNCSNGRVCLNNQCVKRCKTNPDCDRNERCVKNVCVECKSDRDCNKGEKCNRKNKCVNK